MEYMRRLIMCAMLNNFAIFSDEICYEWTDFTKWIPENEIKLSLLGLYNSYIRFHVQYWQSRITLDL